MVTVEVGKSGDEEQEELHPVAVEEAGSVATAVHCSVPNFDEHRVYCFRDVYFASTAASRSSLFVKVLLLLLLRLTCGYFLRPGLLLLLLETFPVSVFPSADEDDANEQVKSV